MKKLLAPSAAFLFLINAVSASADINITPSAPSQGVNPNANVSTVLGNAITIIFVLALLLVLFFLIIGAFQWITSQGDKDKLSKARGTIINAIIGLVILAVAFLIVNVLGNILHIDFKNLVLPSLDKGACGPTGNATCSPTPSAT